MNASVSASERTQLEVHVDMCQLRYEQLEKRLTVVEDKLEDLAHKIDKNTKSQITAIIAATATIVSSCLGTIILIVMST